MRQIIWLLKLSDLSVNDFIDILCCPELKIS